MTTPLDNHILAEFIAADKRVTNKKLRSAKRSLNEDRDLGLGVARLLDIHSDFCSRFYRHDEGSSWHISLVGSWG